MKRKLWQRRLLCCFLAVAVLLGGLLCCLPVRAGAIVPLGLVQSALASYVTSTGYKMYNDQGTGQDILGSLSDLYQTWLDSPAGAVASQWTLAHIAAIEAVYTDTSGQIVIKKAAADVFQQFADWIQTEYSVPVGSDSPTSVVSPSGGSSSLLSGPAFSGISYPISITNASSFRWKSLSGSSDHYNVFLASGDCSGALFSTSSRSHFFVASKVPLQVGYDYGFSDYPSPSLNGSLTSATFNGLPVYYGWVNAAGSLLDSQFANNSVTSFPSGSSTQTELAYHMLYGDLAEVPGIAGLGVTLAQAVADVVGQAKDDDAVVIGVGAGVGATAQDIADMVAQGIKAQTLDPSVSITAEAVIDTPVQPYPDIDGLGLPTLGAALVSRFPFCVPWDFVDTLNILNADPIPPVFDVTLVPASVAARWGVSGNYTIHVDLTSQEYAKLFVALRWGTLVGFCLGLALLTKRLIWTA